MPEIAQSKLRPRDRDAIIQSLRAGVTPRIGLQHIQVGRVHEVEALLKDKMLRKSDSHRRCQIPGGT